MAKTQLSKAQIEDYLKPSYGAIKLQGLSEGEESQAFWFESNGENYIIRINQEKFGFEKDRYAYEHFPNNLHIPEVLEIDEFDKTHKYCVSKKLPGITFQDVEPGGLGKLTKPVFDVMEQIHKVDITYSAGFGEFNLRGVGKFNTWREYLLSVIDPKYYNWQQAEEYFDKDKVAVIKRKYKSLVEYCPESRSLVHGDYGSNNVMVDNDLVTGVVDWENAMYGDYLYDIAIIYFWRTWLDCMAAEATYIDLILAKQNIYNLKNRLLCYQLRIGLHEIHDNSLDKDTKMTEWLTNRSLEIIENN